MIHIGQKIKEVIHREKIQVNEFARRIGKSRAVVYDIFERETIDTGLLRRISNALDYDFFQHYISENSTLEEPGLEPYKKKSPPDSQIKMQLDIQKIQLQNAQREIEYLKKIISLLEKDGK